MRLALLAIALLVPLTGTSQARLSGSPEELYGIVSRGATCKTQVSNESLWRCEYSVGSALKFSIAVESNGIRNIAFTHSDMGDDFYAVVYDGCVAVIPAARHPRNYGLDYVAYVSPADGRVYRELSNCKSARG